MATMSAASRHDAWMIQQPARNSFGSKKGPSVNTATFPRLSIAETAREVPFTLGNESLVKCVGAGLFADYGS